jgi:endonuclease/exonuclease/phosphatase family metal-dependent hydrolase
MSGKVKKWSLCNNNTDKNNPKHFSVCVNNISNVFDTNNKLDFITLQEATDYDKLIKESATLKNMKYEVYESGLDIIVTFWDAKKYKLQNKITGEFEKGRPWMATIFNDRLKQKLCIINVHMGHYVKEEEFKMMEKMILDIKKKINTNKSNIRYIISGDFNYDIKEFGESRDYFTLDNTKFYYNKKHILTCCINRLRHNDHVIDSLEKPIDISIPEVAYMASDHKPILVKVNPF